VGFTELLEGFVVTRRVRCHCGKNRRKKYQNQTGASATPSAASSIPYTIITSQAGLSFDQAIKDRSFWGRLVESAVGAHLVNESSVEGFGIYYWREGQKEVDYVMKKGRSITAIEVKSAMTEGALPGMDEFAKKFKPRKLLLVGKGGIPLEQFLGNPITRWIE